MGINDRPAAMVDRNSRCDQECLSAALRIVTSGHLEKMPFHPISASQKNEKFSHISNMLRFLIFLFLDLERKF